MLLVLVFYICLVCMLCFVLPPGAALKMNETLQELFLADNKLVPTDGAQLGNLLRYNHRLGLLDLRNNHLAVSHADTGAFCPIDQL